VAKTQKIQISIEDEKYLPEKAHDQDACFDLKAKLDREIEILPGEVVTVDTGIKLQLPNDWEAQIRPRSGLAAKFGLSVVNSPGTIDSGYTGAIKVVLGLQKLISRNDSFRYAAKNQQSLTIKDGMRIAQIAFRRVPKISLEVIETVTTASDRADGGFGSSGV
jgi:dUTP pyrophosphatase